MRFTIVAVGTRGDVQPYVALGVGLRASSHSVRVATHSGFESLVGRHGLGFSPVAGDPRPVIESDAGRAWMEQDHHDLVVLRGFTTWADHVMRQRLADCWQASEDADCLITSPLGILAAYHVAEKRRVPLIRAFYLPATPTRAYPAPIVPRRLRLGGRFNLWTHRVAQQLLWSLFRSRANLARRAILRLPPLPAREPFSEMDRRGQLVLYCYSPAVLPPPEDWGDWIHVTGYWFLDRPPDWRPPSGLVDFLESGPPPVYVGFGSMCQ